MMTSPVACGAAFSFSLASATRNSVQLLLVLLVLQVPGAWAADAEGFSFAGLSLKTTAAELRQRYPASRFAGNHVQIAPAEARDHVYGITFPDGSAAATLKLSFVRSFPDQAGRPSAYPPCRPLLNRLQANYGAPAAIEIYAEENAWNRRHIWRHGSETLWLHCFRQGGVGEQAEMLSISRVSR